MYRGWQADVRSGMNGCKVGSSSYGLGAYTTQMARSRDVINAGGPRAAVGLPCKYAPDVGLFRDAPVDEGAWFARGRRGMERRRRSGRGRAKAALLGLKGSCFHASRRITHACPPVR